MGIYVKNKSDSIVSLGTVRLAIPAGDIIELPLSAEDLNKNTEIQKCIEVGWLEVVEAPTPEIRKASLQEALDHKRAHDKRFEGFTPGAISQGGRDKAIIVDSKKVPKPEVRQGLLEEETVEERIDRIEKAVQKDLEGIKQSVVEDSSPRDSEPSKQESTNSSPVPVKGLYITSGVKELLTKPFFEKKSFILKTKDIGYLREISYADIEKGVKELCLQRIKELEEENEKNAKCAT